MCARECVRGDACVRSVLGGACASALRRAEGRDQRELKADRVAGACVCGCMNKRGAVCVRESVCERVCARGRVCAVGAALGEACASALDRAGEGERSENSRGGQCGESVRVRAGAAAHARVAQITKRPLVTSGYWDRTRLMSVSRLGSRLEPNVRAYRPFHDGHAPSHLSSECPDEICRLVAIVNGCQDNTDGIHAKITLVRSFIAAQKGRANLIDVACWLHLQRAVTIQSAPLLRIVRWQRPKTPRSESDQHADAVQDANRPGLFVASALEACASADDMAAVVETYVASNRQLNVVEMLRYVNWRGFVQIDAATLLSAGPPRVIDWTRPPDEPPFIPNWRLLWKAKAEELEHDEPKFPRGPPTYFDARDTRGRTARVAFLGSIDRKGGSATATLRTPAELLTGPVWQLPAPSMCISADAGSLHPRRLDSIDMMAHLPQYKEWVGANASLHGGSDFTEDSAESASFVAKKKGSFKRGARDRVAPPGPIKKAVDIEQVMRRSIEEWQQELQPVDTESLMEDTSIGGHIYTKLTEVFSALLDAATLAGAWIVLDRTDGQGSATAEALLDLALERGAQRPTIVVVDSLERLGRARSGSRAHKMLHQLCRIFHDSENATPSPIGTEAELSLDFLYSLDEFDQASAFSAVPDEELPFPVAPEHKRKHLVGAEHDTCHPNRKWRYFYVDGLFANATHYVLKSNDTDAFDMESLTRMGYLYAHGDTRTYHRLRANIQQGKAIVMLHNSGSVTTAFSWLQRVMAFNRPAPSQDALRGPLKFLLANLSKANWVHDFGVPEVIMMRGLAERAPQLFRQQIVSVDLLTDGEEQMLDVMRSCFSSLGGVPDLRLGNAETTSSSTRGRCTSCSARMQTSSIAGRSDSSSSSGSSRSSRPLSRSPEARSATGTIRTAHCCSGTCRQPLTRRSPRRSPSLSVMRRSCCQSSPRSSRQSPPSCSGAINGRSATWRRRSLSPRFTSSA